MKKDELQAIAHFVYEAGILSKTPRSGLWFLGTGSQSVAEHLLRTTYITYALCYLTPKADRAKAIYMSLFHDFGEGRTSDLNYVHQRYGRLAESQAFKDIAMEVPFGKEMGEFYAEEQVQKTLEAKLVKDADGLEWLATLREEELKGNTKARVWQKSAFLRLKTKEGKAVGKYLLSTHPDSWYFDEKDKWFVSRDPKLARKKKPTTKGATRKVKKA
jgi:putative hydrolase of HD superfamily